MTMTTGITQTQALIDAGVSGTTCPKCGEAGVWNKRGTSFVKCFAHGGCGWKYPTRKNEEQINPIKQALATLYKDWKQALIQPEVPSEQQAALMAYLTDGDKNNRGRGIHPEVIESAPIGMVPAGYDPEPIIRETRKQVELCFNPKGKTQKDMDAFLEAHNKNFSDTLRSGCKNRAGWMVFFYQDAHEDYISANFRQIAKDENGKNVVRMWSPLGRRGVFHPFIGGYTAVGGAHNRVLVTEGEFNQLQYLSAYAREYEGWKDEAYCCMTAGASSGVDQKTVWATLRGMTYEGEADLFPVVCEDGDEAGKKVTHAIAEGGFTYHFTLPKFAPVLTEAEKLYRASKPLPQDMDAYIKRTDDEQALKTVAELMVSAPMACRPMAEVKQELDCLRSNPADENDNRLPGHILHQKVYEFVEHDLRTRAEMYLSTYPYLYMTETHTLIRVEEGSPALERLFREYGLLLTEKDSSLVRENLTSYMMSHAQQVDVHKLGCILQLHGTSNVTPDHACYVNKGDGQVYKVTADSITVVDNGTDGAFLLEDDLMPWPDLSLENLQYVKGLQETLGKNGLKVADTPLCNHYRGLYEAQGLTQPQCAQLAFTRLMLHWLGNSVSLHPITVNIGIQNSGKSTQFEKLGKLLYGAGYLGSNLPADMRSLVSGLTNSAMCLYDNVDAADFSRSQASFLDTFCGCATGMMASRAMLYANNTELKFNLRNHLKLTSRVTPFNRSDAMRRTIQLTIRKPSPEEWVSKDEMMAKLMADRDKCLLEILVRLQNIVKAYNQHSLRQSVKHLMVSEMPEYEAWTYKGAEYEGWYQEMRSIWVAYQQMYNDAIAEGNPLVMIIKLWLALGEGCSTSCNAGRKVSTTTLWSEIDALTRELGLKQTYSSVSSFRGHLTKNRSELGTLGYKESSDTSTRLKWFEPTPEQIAQFKQEYKDLLGGAGSRVGWLDKSAGAGAGKPADKSAREALEDWDDPLTQPQ